MSRTMDVAQIESHEELLGTKNKRKQRLGAGQTIWSVFLAKTRLMTVKVCVSGCFGVLWVRGVMADFGQTYLGQSDFGQSWAELTLANFSVSECRPTLAKPTLANFSVLVCCCVLLHPTPKDPNPEPWERGPALRGPAFLGLVLLWLWLLCGCCWVGLPWTTFRRTPPPLDPPSAGPPKISLYFFPLPPTISLFLCLSGCLLVEFWWFL